MNAETLRLLWQATLALSAALAVVLLLRAPVRRLVGAQAAYALWLLPPVSLLAGFLPAPTIVVPMTSLRLESVANATATAVATTNVATSFDPAQWLLPLWLAGAFACVALLWRQQHRFVRALGRVRPLARGLWQAECGEGCPAVIGVLPPRLVLPPDFESRYESSERELILAHERAHLARGDAFANAVAALLRGAFWFHPLLHHAVARFRHDQELACDAAVLRHFPQSRRAYADTMLKTQLAVLGLPVGCHWQSSHPLKERIAMLKHPLPNLARRVLGFGFAAVLALAGGYAAWAAQPASVEAAPAATRSGKPYVKVEYTLRIDDKQPNSFSTLSALGDKFAISYNSSEVATPPALDGEFVVTEAADGNLHLAATFKRDGKPVGEPRLILHEGEPGGIKIGEEHDGHFHGIAMDLTLTRLSAEEAERFRAQKKSGSAATRNEARDEPVAASVRQTPSKYMAMAERPAQEIDGVRLAKPPRYPAAAIKQRVEGKVVLRVLVDESGIPKQVEVHSAKAFAPGKSNGTQSADAQEGPTDPAMLVDAAKAVIWDWRFEPALHDGNAVQDWLDVPFMFAIR